MSRLRPIEAVALPEDVRSTWLTAAAADAARESGAPAELLGAYLDMLADAALTGRRLDRTQLDAVNELGRQAAAQGVAARRMAHLYLSAAAGLWSTIPIKVRARDRNAVFAAAEAVLIAVEGAVAALVEGHESERRRRIRHEESVRRQFVDDLLRGDSDVASLVERGEPFGLDFGLGHQVALAVPSGKLVDEVAVAAALECSIADAYAGREVLVDVREGQFIIVAPEVPPTQGGRRSRPDVGKPYTVRSAECAKVSAGGSPPAERIRERTAFRAPTRRPARRSSWPRSFRWTRRSSTRTTCSSIGSWFVTKPRSAI